MKLLLLSAYDAASHRVWREALVKHCPQHEWTVLTLPPRYFSWRIRGNSLSWALGEAQSLSRHFDAMVATSMVDLAALRGLQPALARVPALLYFHENQFAYPTSQAQSSSVEPQIVNLYSALSAQRLAFNSAYNRDTFLEGVADLLRRLPDAVPAGIVERLAARSDVLPVPLSLPDLSLPETATPAPGRRQGARRLNLVWNHRWEYDKGPEHLLRAVKALVELGVRFRLHVLGQQFRRSPPAFQTLHAWLRTHQPAALGSWGYEGDERQYRRRLLEADVVLSTALHDFQGLAVQEAVLAGCVPLLPRRLCYPEFFPEQCLYDSRIDDPALEARALARRLLDWQCRGLPACPSLQSLLWPSLQPRYDALLNSLRNESAGEKGGECGPGLRL